jgi:hypothetical protein
LNAIDELDADADERDEFRPTTSGQRGPLLGPMG